MTDGMRERVCVCETEWSTLTQEGSEEAAHPSVFQTWRQTTVSVTLTPPAADERCTGNT